MDQAHKLHWSHLSFSPFAVKTLVRLLFNKGSIASPCGCSPSSFHNTRTAPQALHWDSTTLCIESHMHLQTVHIWGPVSWHLFLLWEARMWDITHVTLTTLSWLNGCVQNHRNTQEETCLESDDTSQDTLLILYWISKKHQHASCFEV